LAEFLLTLLLENHIGVQPVLGLRRSKQNRGRQRAPRRRRPNPRVFMGILNHPQSYRQFNSVSILARLNRTRAYCTWWNACWAATRAKAANCHPPHKFRAAAMFPRAATANRNGVAIFCFCDERNGNLELLSFACLLCWQPNDGQQFLPHGTGHESAESDLQ
jgi:hypothetical protein